MDESWLSVGDAAAELDLSAQRVRELLGAGVLAGRKLGGTWFVDPIAVQRRDAQSRRPGRPLSPANAWRLLALIDPSSPGSQDDVLGAASAVDRSRLRALLAGLPDAEGLARRVSRRVDVRRVRVHEGVLARVLDDPKVSVGAGRAVAAHGGGVAAGGLDRIYLRARDLESLERRYRLVDDVEGNLELAIVPDEVDDAIAPPAGRPVPLSVAWADLLDDPDVRARAAARAWVAALPRDLVIADGRRR